MLTLSLHRSNRRPALGVAAAVAALALGATAAVAQPTVDRQAQIHGGLYELASWTQDGSVWVNAVGSQFAEGAKVIQLDGSTLEQIRAIDVPDARAFGMAINQATGTVYTTNTRDGTMSAIDIETGEVTVISDPNADGTPHLYRIAIDESRNMVYASLAQTPGLVWAVDGSTNTLDRVIDAGGARPTGIVVDAARNRLYVSNIGDDFVSVIDLSNDAIIDRIPTAGSRSTQMAFDPATDRLFVGNQGNHGVTVIDLEEMRAVKFIPTGDQPVGIGFNPVSNQIYTANRAGGTVTVIDAESYEEVAELEIGSNPNTIFVDESTGLVYVSNKAARSPQGQEPTQDPRGDMVTIIRP
ncbi:YncE family protein [Gemmatimonadota bacterium DH-20]|uniref:YncE family protein n=1 Tax=Gaopeijia maritima TaxID=3119007 RepID=A0ABU9ECU4_9BACT